MRRVFVIQSSNLLNRVLFSLLHLLIAKFIVQGLWSFFGLPSSLKMKWPALISPFRRSRHWRWLSLTQIMTLFSCFKAVSLNKTLEVKSLHKYCTKVILLLQCKNNFWKLLYKFLSDLMRFYCGIDCERKSFLNYWNRRFKINLWQAYQQLFFPAWRSWKHPSGACLCLLV